jgi:hypothetical protein
MQFVWLAIVAVSLVPVAVVGFFANPLVFLVSGPERWREQMTRLRPYRRWLLLSIVVCGFATALYAARYG